MSQTLKDRYIYQKQHVPHTSSIELAENRNNKYKIVPKETTVPFRKAYVKSLADDFYSNLIDWSDNQVLYAAENTLCQYDFYTGGITQLCTFPGMCLNSVKTLKEGSVCIGTSMGYLYEYDFITNRLKRTQPHKSRIGVMEYYSNMLITGSRDRTIRLADTRSGTLINVLATHTQEVCGIKISRDGGMIASGGNDNKLMLHDMRKLGVPIKMKNHKAAVKALAWSPLNSSLLISGGGTADKTIKMWDINKKEMLIKSSDCGSQVCNLYWTKRNEIISTHGYSMNDVRISSAGSLQTRDIFFGHRNRVIHFAIDKNEEFVVSGSSDSELNFWRVGNCADKKFVR